jgi:hypothetical protein
MSAGLDRGRPRLKLRSWKPLQKGSLVGFAGVTLPSGLEIDNVAVFIVGSRRWVNLPARPMRDANGQPMLDDKGKPKYIPLLRWGTHDLNERFGKAVIAAIEAEHGTLDGGAF